jgi:hypothetical protein
MGFLVSVKGGKAPEHVHETVDQAITEALRLQGSLVGNGESYAREVKVLEEVLTLPSRQKGVPLDYSAIKIHNYQMKITGYTLLSLLRATHIPL